MMIPRWFQRAAVLLAIPLAAGSLAAQGVTTGAVNGIVRNEQGQPLDQAQVSVTNVGTGYTATVVTSDAGRYHVAGLEVGTYRVTVRHLGYQPVVKNDVVVSLGNVTRMDFDLQQQAAQLSEVTVTATQDQIISPSHQGAETTVSDSALRRLPTLNRNFTDFVALTPQVSTTLFNGGLSGGGTNNRYNNVQIDGTSEADIFGLGSTGQPGGQANGKSIGLEAVKEYQVLLAPYDVRQGFFAGLSVNAVTKSGTNDFSGTAFFVNRNQSYTRKQDYISDYEQQQYGFSLGGPIVKDKAFFFISPEFQTRTTPAGGAYLGQDGFTDTDQAEANAFVNALGQYQGLATGGTFGLVNNENPLANIFARVDINLPHNTQLVLRHNYGHAEDDIFSRSSSSFKLSNNGYFFNSTKNAPALQLRTLFSDGSYNELLAGYTRIRDRRTPNVRAPEITVNAGVSFVSGAERFSHGNELDQDVLELTDNFSKQFGAHRATIGTQNQFYKFRNLFAQSTFGVWRFQSIDSLTNGLPDQFIVGVPLEPDGAGGVQPGGDGAVRFSSSMHSFYAQDEWTVSPTLNVTLGLRADVPLFADKPTTNPDVLTSYGRNTADIPSGNIEFSPRFGFNWDVTGDEVNQLRGGIGLFTGRPAYVWLSNAFQNSGMGAVALLTCTGAAKVPAFNNGTIATPPNTCADGQSASLGSEIDLLDPDFKHPQNLRATLGFDRLLVQNWIGTAELLYTRGVNGVFYQNFALAGPQGTNALEGRVIYGTAPNNPVLKPGGRSQIFDASNQSNDHAVSITAGLQRRYTKNYEASLFYTYTRAYDVQSFTSSTAFSQLRFGRVWGGNLLDKTATRSSFEQRHRLVGQATYTFPTKTDVSVTYFGESGSPYTYIASGDLNGDGLTLNDPIYVPNDATNPAEMRFTSTSSVTATPAEQAAAFERYIEGEDCLKNNRGKLLPRNACTAPFTNIVNVSARQSFETFHLQNVTFQLDVFNFLNLLNKRWGLVRSPGTSPITLLSGSSYVNGTILTGQPNYTFNPNFTRYFSNNLASNYQIQLQARYAF